MGGWEEGLNLGLWSGGVCDLGVHRTTTIVCCVWANAVCASRRLFTSFGTFVRGIGACAFYTGG